MTAQELKTLRRVELLELLLTLSRENEDLRDRLAKAETALEEREIVLEEAGSIAEASLRLGGVFEAAQAAADRYLESVRSLLDRQRQICAQMERDSRERMARELEETRAACRRMELETKMRLEPQRPACPEEPDGGEGERADETA